MPPAAFSPVPLRILATGKALPEQVWSAQDLDVRHGRPDGYTLRKSGVRIRHVAQPHETQSELGARALRNALAEAGLRPDDLDLLISGCAVAEQALPNTAAFIAHHAGLPPGTEAFDVNASCLGFLASLQVATALLSMGRHRRIAIVCADLPSRGVDWNDPGASLIFGDGAAAVVLDAGIGHSHLEALHLATYPEGRHHCELRAGGSQRNPRNGVKDTDHLFAMDGPAVLRLSLRVLPNFLPTLMHTTTRTCKDIDLVVPHQASHLGLSHGARRLGLRDEQVMRILETHGNQVSASLPTALHEARHQGRARPGQGILMIGTAAGLTLGGAVLTL
jgi:3-oxoacyl-[acyl-carrier-protein] synthase III